MSEVKKIKKTNTAVKPSTKKEVSKVVKKVEPKKVVVKEVVKKEVTKKEVTKKDVVKKDVVKKDVKKDNKSLFSGKYIQAIGRRKTAVAQVRMYEKGSGDIVINGISGLDYFKKEENLSAVLQPLKVVSKVKDFDISIMLKGGGILGQLEASRHGISRALIKYDPEFRAMLKTSGYITRDPRKKERKKPGLKKARKAPQWSKR